GEDAGGLRGRPAPGGPPGRAAPGWREGGTMRLKPLLAGLATFMPGLSRVALRPTGGTDSVPYSYSVWLRHLVLARRHGLDAFPHAVGPSWGRATPSARASRPSSRERRPTSPSTPSN